MVDVVLYYLSDPDGTPVLRLIVLEQLRMQVIGQYRDDNGHLGIDKIYDAIRRKYYWQELYKQLMGYVQTCVSSQQRNLRKKRAPLQEMDTAPFPFAKLSLDLSGPYLISLSGRKYIVSFVDHYSG